jgi:hypothetical protein
MRRGRMWRVIATAGVLALAATACPEEENDQAAEVEEDGEAPAADTDFEGDWFNVIAMAHSSPQTPQGWDVPLETSPWDGESTGTFSYSSIACADDAPINNISTNLTTFNSRLPESRSPASTRLHPIEFEVTDEVEDGTGEFTGTVEMVACQLRAGVVPEDDEMADEDRDRIIFEFDADFERTAPEEIRYTGTFTISEGTGEYEGLTGDGEIGGYIMCLGPDDCADFGEFRDIQVAMIGTYDHPDLDDLRQEDPTFEDTEPIADDPDAPEAPDEEEDADADGDGTDEDTVAPDEEEDDPDPAEDDGDA